MSWKMRMLQLIESDRLKVCCKHSLPFQVRLKWLITICLKQCILCIHLYIYISSCQGQSTNIYLSAQANTVNVWACFFFRDLIFPHFPYSFFACELLKKTTHILSRISMHM